MNVIIITQGVSRILEPMLNSRYNIVGIIEAAGRKNKIKKNHLVSRLVNKRTRLKDYCLSIQVPYYYMDKNEDANLERWIHQKEADVIVVFGMSMLLKSNIFSIPSKGTINLHPSYLPEYRGPSPCFWQYYDLEMNPGCTVHYIDDGEDTGDIIVQDRVRIELGVRSPDRLDLLIGELGSALLLKSLSMIELNEHVRTRQTPDVNQRRARNITNEEHGNIIDWTKFSGLHVWHILRGTESWLDAIPSPKGIYKGQRWKIGEFFLNGHNYTPGSIGNESGEKVIYTKDGYIKISIDFHIKKMIKHILGL